MTEFVFYSPRSLLGCLLLYTVFPSNPAKWLLIAEINKGPSSIVVKKKKNFYSACI